MKHVAQWNQVPESFQTSLRLLVRVLPFELGPAKEMGFYPHERERYMLAAMFIRELLPQSARLDREALYEKFKALKTRSFELEGKIGEGFYQHYISLLNGSCRSNVVIGGTPRRMFGVALRDIKAGEELTLQVSLQVGCKCGHCNDPFRLVEDPGPVCPEHALMFQEMPHEGLEPVPSIRLALLIIKGNLDTKKAPPRRWVELARRAESWYLHLEEDYLFLDLHRLLKRMAIL